MTRPQSDGTVDVEPSGVFADVLCAVDGSPGGFSSVEHAAALTGPGGHITLLAVTSFRSAGAHRGPAIAPLEATEILDRAVQIAAEAGVKTTVEVDPATPPARVILEWAAEHDLLAMGAPTTPWFAGLFGGGPAAAAIDKLLTPVLISRPGSAPCAGAGPIVVASDGLDGSDQLVEFAGRLANSCSASVHLLHAAGHEFKSRTHPRIAQQAEALGRALAGASQVSVERSGARSAIIEIAQSVAAPMVVMSSRRLHGARAIGSVSRYVVHAAGCSVLLIPPEHLQG